MIHLNRPLRAFALAASVGVAGCAGLPARMPGEGEPTAQATALARPAAPKTASANCGGASGPTLRTVALEQEIEAVQREGMPIRLLPAPARESEASAGLRPRTISEALQGEVEIEESPAEPAIYNLDMTTALELAGGQNPQIAFAAARYREAYARLTAARTLWLPSIRAGLSYHHHDGNYQDVAGAIVDVDRSSLQAGLGVLAVGAGTTPVPGVVASFHASDAIFQPKIALHAAAARQAATRTATNDTLLATSLAYLDLLRAMQALRIAESTRDNARNLADLTESFARAGQGPPADADRAQTELFRRRNDVSRAEEAAAVASARLAEQLSLDSSVQIAPTEPTVAPIDLVSAEIPKADLIATGLTNRPELEEAQYLVCEAVYRYRREKYAPFVPSVLLGVSQSTFGGGLGSDLDEFAGRFDFDAAAFWELRNLGFGEVARRDETRSRYDQVRMLQVQVMDRVAREVAEGHAQVQARRQQISLAESGVQSATDSYERNFQRIREGQGLPIEVLQSLQALDEAQREYLRTIVDYNEAQFRLQRALGWPIQ